MIQGGTLLDLTTPAGQAAVAGVLQTRCRNTNVPPFNSVDELSPGQCSAVYVKACDRAGAHSITFCRRPDGQSYCIKDPNCRPAQPTPGVATDACYTASAGPSGCRIFDPTAPDHCDFLSYSCPYGPRGEELRTPQPAKWCNPKFADYEVCENTFPPETRDNRIENGVLKCPKWRCWVAPETNKWACYYPADKTVVDLAVGPETKVDCCTSYPRVGDRVPVNRYPNRIPEGVR